MKEKLRREEDVRRMYRASVLPALGVQWEEDAPPYPLIAVKRRQWLKPRVMWERGKLNGVSEALNDPMDLGEGAFREHCGVAEFEGLSQPAGSPGES